jgi:hypothetical protein
VVVAGMDIRAELMDNTRNPRRTYRMISAAVEGSCSNFSAH